MVPKLQLQVSPLLSPEELFMEEHKEDQSLFPELLNEHLHQSWHHLFELKLHRTNMSETLNHVPETPEEQQEFKIMQNFMHRTLKVKVLMPGGKKL